MKYLALLVIVLLLSSCSSNSEDEEKEIGEPFIGGYSGLGVAVLEGAPPAVVTDERTASFGIVLTLEGLGESDVGPDTENPFALVRLEGIVPEHFDTTIEGLARVVGEKIRGSKKNFDGSVIPGGITVAGFQPLTYVNRVIGSELFTIFGQVCYDYSTHSSFKICLKDNPVEHFQDDSVCQLRGDLYSRNSGAPLHVIEVDQNPVGRDRIQVNFVIQNVGNGVFFDRSDDSIETSCNFDISSSDIYRALVVVNPTAADDFSMECRSFDNDKTGFENVALPDDAVYRVVKFSNNAPRSFTCFFERKGDIENKIFQELMEIDLFYRYAEFVEIPLLVQEASLV